MHQVTRQKRESVWDVREHKYMLLKIGRHQKEIQLDKEDYEKYFIKGNFFSISSHGYVRCMNYIGLYPKTRTGKYSNRYLHRMVTDAPKGMFVDHINHDKLDNRKSNLRICNPKLSSYNVRSKGGSSKHKGVYFQKSIKRWISQISYNNKTYYVGTFEDENEAALEYNKWAKEHHGEYACLNTIS